MKSFQPRGFFITGTDTGVGKTVVGTAIVKWLHAQGYAVYPRKPVESGCNHENGKLMAADGLLYAEAINNRKMLDVITPYRFKAAVSAERAATLEGVSLSIADLKRAVMQEVTAEGIIIVEGAGGFYSPLARDGNNADLAVALGLPVILVVSDRLGCLNHALLTLEAAAKRQLIVAAIIMNANIGYKLGEMNNTQELQQKTKIPVLPYPMIKESVTILRSEIIKILISALNDVIKS